MAAGALLTINTDGGSRGNPGPAAFAYVIARDGQPPIEEAGRLGNTTNNVAEYTALVRALEHALELGPEHRVAVVSDSELMVKQMKGEYRVKNADLIDLYEEARELCGHFKDDVSFRHVRREYNKRADELCNEALDGNRSPTPRAPKDRPPAPAQPAEVAVKPPPTPPPPPLALREEALACLRQAASAWATGATTPTAEAVWEQLVDAIHRHCLGAPGE